MLVHGNQFLRCQRRRWASAGERNSRNRSVRKEADAFACAAGLDELTLSDSACAICRRKALFSSLKLARTWCWTTTIVATARQQQSSGTQLDFGRAQNVSKAKRLYLTRA